MGILATRMSLVPRSSFGFSQPDPAELWIDEDGVRHESPSGSGVAPLDDIRAEDAEVVVGDMREGRSAFDIPRANTPGGWSPASHRLGQTLDCRS